MLACLETLLKESDIDLYNIHGYKPLAMPRVYVELGGVLLYVMNTCSYEVRKDRFFRNEYCECLFIAIDDAKPVNRNKLINVKSDKHACYL